jgi:hypothetical protein
MDMRIAAIALLVGSLGVAACGDSDNLNFVTPLSQLGTFTLVSVNGNALPAIVVDSVSPPLIISALSGQIVINANRTFSSTVALQQSLAGVITNSTRSCTGTWSSPGINTITFVEAATTNCGRTFTGTFVGTTLTASVLGVSAVFTQ